ncbi:BTB/POZ domain-containing protein 2 [Folsomia candida]|uniref:BTB/POZ domain-containing protein 2 n=1 Tax=Folsomia candida TaxID=158441 RepID=A0A226ED44_FOLCA|nr:BTB/POZ domain-containing protein 2 [Folsomia candida]
MIYVCEIIFPPYLDVVFLVGYDDQWRIPAHKTILYNSTPVFRAMFSEYFSPQHNEQGGNEPHKITVSDVDGRAFDNLLRHLYAQEMAFQSVETALRTLYAAHKYQCPELVQKCVDYLSQNLNVNNILSILSNIPLLCGNVQNLENWGRERQMMQEMFLTSSSFPGGQEVHMSATDDNPLNFSQLAAAQNPESEYLDCIETDCSRLLQKCLNFVDKEANSVLLLDEMEDLDVDTFRLILSRDTLDISDENLAFNAILKWTDKECKRKQLPLTTESKRTVLGESLFLPRYLTMSLASFLCELGPAKSGLFTPEEISCLTRILKNGSRAEIQNELSSPPNNPLGIPTTLRPYYRNLARPRCPIRTIGHPSPAKKSKRGGGLSLIERWNHRRCCRSRRNNRGSRSNSQLSSPSNSNPSSPRRNFSNADQSKKWNLCVERVVIFLACLFD